MTILHEAKVRIRELRRRLSKPKLPLRGYNDHRLPIKYLDLLDDGDLAILNSLLPWNAFVADREGRRFGDVAWKGKREVPQPVPDPRIVRLHDRFDLRDKHVLEIGCFEGIHTLGLLQYAERVTAIDSRVENVVKTIVRCAFFGYSPEVFKWDVEQPPRLELLACDVAHHVGVLYHLADPVSHLRSLGTFVRRGVMLDTHYAEPHEATDTADGFRYKRYAESGRGDVFSGMHDHAKWLLLADIERLLRESGFGTIEIVETRQERNGPRVWLFAER